MTQAIGYTKNQQHIRQQAGKWLRLTPDGRKKHAHQTRSDAIRAAEAELLLTGGGQITIDVARAESMEQTPAAAPTPISVPASALQVVTVEGVPIFRASVEVQERIEDLMYKLREEGLTDEESAELDRYEDIDLYFSYINRLIRNAHLGHSE